MSLREFRIKLVSSAFMATFAENRSADFTTLSPEQLNLTGFWKVASAELEWHTAIQNTTSGHFNAPRGVKVISTEQTASETLK